MDSTFLSFLFLLCVGVSLCNNELYDVLGISRGASSKEIKQAYKRLAREWHPDKNRDPSATDKFTKINEAYETLSDPEKRANYDNYGFTSAQDRQPRHHPGGGFHPFDQFFSGGFGHPFGFGGGDGNGLEKFHITLRNFESKLNPQSYQNPCFFYVYADFCFSCMRIEPVVSKFINELDSIGMCVGVIHLSRSRGLASHFHIHSAPTLMGLVSGRAYFYKSNSISFNYLRDFMQGLFPSYTMTMLNDGNFKSFLDGWKDNRVRAVFFGKKSEPSLRFLAPAFFHAERVAFGYVNTDGSDVSTILKKNNINKYRESLYIWNEEAESPTAAISMQQLSRSTIDEVVASNKFLSLPRLSSQKVFEELCPEQPKHKKQKKLCVALLTRRSANHEVASSTFRSLAQTSKFSSEFVQFAYIYEDVQQSFIKALAKGNETRSHVVVEVIIFWRLDSRRVQYEFLEQGWSLDPELTPQSRNVLEKRLTQILEGDNLLPYRAIIPEFYNEHMLSLFTRIVYKLGDWSDRAYYYFVSYDGMTVITAVAAIAFMGMMAMSMRKLAESEAEQMKKEKMARQAQKRPPSCSQDNQTIHLYEIRSETFANLVSEADTGLTIAVLVDETSKEKLLRVFAEIMQPYSRYSGLTFAFLQLEYYLDWYRHLLELSLDFKISLESINNRNCVGTVLALNGYRKYYYIYHPKRARKWMRKHHGSNVTRAVGFGDSDSSDSDEKGSREESILFLDEVLSGLSLWLDRVFDGSVKKVRLSYWPEMR